ncbi:MAG: hypothetical protein AAF805_04540 [Planctomycetota bacterium]
MRVLAPLVATVAVAVTAGSAPADPGEIVYTVLYDDPFGDFDAATRAAIDAHVLAAGAEWDALLIGAASIEVLVTVTRDIPRATGASVTSSFVGFDGQFNVFEQGMAGEINTGADPNGSGGPDVELTLNPDYLFGELWLDPDPVARTASVPASRTDAMSVFVHEFGHAIAYNGWIDGVTGQLPGDFRSPFDAWTEPVGGDFFFAGPNAVALRDEPSALTFANPFHWGNRPPRAGEELIPELMNGVVFERGVRYEIGPLDRAVLLDVGLEVVPTSPGDYDADGALSPNDLLVWSRSFGLDGLALADGNGDGRVDAADYTIWRDASASASIPVPEPRSLLVGLLGVLAASGRFPPMSACS